MHHSKLITRENHSPKKRIQSPVELELESPLAGNDENDSEARSDSGGWYYESEGTLENTEEYPSPQTNGLTGTNIKNNFTKYYIQNGKNPLLHFARAKMCAMTFDHRRHHHYQIKYLRCL